MPPVHVPWSLPVRTLLALLVIASSLTSLALPSPVAGQATPTTEGEPSLRWQVEPPDGWVQPRLDGEQASAVIAGDVVVWPTDRLRGYDLATGDVRWEAGPELQALPATLAVAGGIVIAGVPGRVDDPEVGGATPDIGAFSVVGIDGASGAIRWSTAVDDAIGVPVVAEGRAFMVVGGRRLAAIDTVTGDLLWEQAAAGAGQTGPAVSDGVVTVTLGETGVAAFAASDGASLWTSAPSDDLATPNPAQFPGYPATGPAMGDGVVVYGRSRPLPPSTPDEYEDIIALDAATGAVRWQTVTDAFLYAPVTVATGMVFVQGGDAVRAFSVETGGVVWEFRTSDGQVISAPPVVADGVVYTGGRGERVHALAAASGTLLWEATTRQGIAGPVAVGDGVVVVASGSGTLRTIDSGAAAASSGSGTSPAGGAAVADVSGLPPCTVSPREPLDESRLGRIPPIPVVAGTPAATLVEPVPDQYGQFMAPAIALDDLPVGPSADLETVAALEALVSDLEACSRTSDDRESLYDVTELFQDEASYAALFSDDFLRRPWVADQLAFVGYETIPLLAPVPEIGDDARVLPDGRVAVVSVGTGFYGDDGLYVFVEQDGRWLIDEYLDLTGSGPGR